MSAIGPVDELLAQASWRTEVRPGDGKAGARYERVLVGGEPLFVKQLSPASDWIMRVAGDHVHRPYLAWRRRRVPGPRGRHDRSGRPARRLHRAHGRSQLRSGAGTTTSA